MKILTSYGLSAKFVKGNNTLTLWVNIINKTISDGV